MARHIASAVIVAAAAAALAACTVGGPPSSVALAGRTNTLPSGVPSAPRLTINPSVPVSIPPVPSIDKGPGGVSIPRLPPGLPDMSGINIDGGSVTHFNIGDVSVGPGSLPAGFPTPPGASSIVAITDAHSIGAQLRVTDPTAAYNFWLTALPRAGYPVGTHAITTVNDAVYAGITFGGHGYRSISAIAIVGDTVTIGFLDDGTKTTKQPPATSGNTIDLLETGATRTLACTSGAEVNVVGSGNTITLTGNCGILNVTGTGDTIVADRAAQVNLTGIGDDVTVHGGNPQVNRTGLSDTFHIG